jgi:hypothetical protein
MATAFNLVDYRTVEPVRRPRLRFVEPMAAGPAVQTPVAPEAPVAPVVQEAPVAEVVAETAAVSDRRQAPPSWMIAPPFQGDPVLNTHESWSASQAAPVAPDHGPYQSVRQVPRAGW